MNLYAVVDKKSCCAEYFLAPCGEDAMRIAAIMMMSSRPLYEFASDYVLIFVRDLENTLVIDDQVIVIDGRNLRRSIDVMREERENEKDSPANRV